MIDRFSGSIKFFMSKPNFVSEDNKRENDVLLNNKVFKNYQNHIYYEHCPGYTYIHRFSHKIRDTIPQDIGSSTKSRMQPFKKL